MKKIYKILFLSALILVSVFGLVACNGGDKPVKEEFEYRVYGTDTFATLVSYNGDKEVVEIPSKLGETPVGRIKKNAFSGNATIKTLVIPTSVEEMDGGAFANMKALEKLTIPFVGQFYLSEPTINDNNVENEKKAVDKARTFGFLFGTEEYDGGVAIRQYYNDAVSKDDNGNETATGVETYYLPVTLREVTVSPKASNDGYAIPAYAFKNNNLISKVILNENVTEIGERAFEHCVYLNTLVLPANVKKIGDYAFSVCSGLVSYNATTGRGFAFATENSKLEEIGNNAFEGCNMVNVVIPEGVKKIGNYAFASVLTGLEIAEGGKSLIKTLQLPKSIQSVGDYAFIKCEDLQSVVILAEDKTVSLGTGAFAYCNKLTAFDNTADNQIDLRHVSSVGSLVFAYIDGTAEVTLVNYGTFDKANLIFGSTNVK